MPLWIYSEMENLAIFCADVGSIKAKKFGWAASIPSSNDLIQGENIEDFADLICESVEIGYRIAIGFECPLFVPIRENPALVNSSRKGEGNRSWSAGAGTGALATGLVEVLWVLNKVSKQLGYSPIAEVSWEKFKSSNSVILWEAFVTSTSKGNGHSDDAAIAINCFKAALPDLNRVNAIEEDSVFSLVGAAAIRCGWSSDMSLMSESCVVVKA